MNLQQLYQQVILDHSKRPHGAGLDPDADATVHRVNPTCGDEVTLGVTLTGGVISAVTHDAQGCSISVASASILTDLVTGTTPVVAFARYDALSSLLRRETADEESRAEMLGDAMAFEGVAQFPARVKCAMLPWTAMKEAVVHATADQTTPSKAKEPRA